jgi:hypothetical protein
MTCLWQRRGRLRRAGRDSASTRTESSSSEPVTLKDWRAAYEIRNPNEEFPTVDQLAAFPGSVIFRLIEQFGIPLKVVDQTVAIGRTRVRFIPYGRILIVKMNGIHDLGG